MPRNIADFPITEAGALHYSKVPASSGNRIVHLGLGAFARAHIAVLTQQANIAADTGWRITAVVRSNQQLAGQLQKQNFRYCVMEKSDSPCATVVDVIDELIVWKSQYDSLLNRLSDITTKVVTLTVTEKAYCLDNTGKLDLSHADIQKDLQDTDTAQSVIGLLAQGARIRMNAGSPGFMVLSCDNLSKNGDTLKSALLKFCSEQNQELAHWINAECSFPNTVVDCIVPKVGPEQVQAVQESMDIDDQVPVLCEPFRQWVIATPTPLSLPPWEQAGAEITTSIELFEQLKLRILNATHSVMAYVGLLQGCRWVHQAVKNEAVLDVLSLVMSEITQSFDENPAAMDYFRSVMKRFENPAMEHELSQIACDGSAKIIVRWLPSLAKNLDAGLDQPGFCNALAAWLACWNRIDREEIYGVSDPADEEIISLADLHAQMHRVSRVEISILRSRWKHLLGMTFPDQVLEEIHRQLIVKLA